MKKNKKPSSKKKVGLAIKTVKIKKKVPVRSTVGRSIIKEKKKKGFSDSIHKIRTIVVGIGGGANAVVSDIVSVYPQTSFFVADTDNGVLLKSRNKKKIRTFLFGEDVVNGMGTGMDDGLGRRAAENSRDKIIKLLKGYDLCVFVSCLGGGTGSGAVPVFAQISKELKIVGCGIFTLPFSFERDKKQRIAGRALKNVKPFLDAVVIIPNERIFKVVDKKTPLREALFVINERLGSSLNGLIEMIHNPGIINIDFADINTILTGRKTLAYLSRVYTQGKERAQGVLRELLNNPLYPYNISGAKRILFNIPSWA